MKFKSRDGEIKRVASTSGQIILVGKEPVDIPDHMEIDAYTAGCIPDGVPHEMPEFTTPEARQDHVFKMMLEMVKRDLPRDITKDGKPNRTTLAKECGFTPSTMEYESAWEAIKLHDGS